MPNKARKGDIVLYHYSPLKGYVPALVENVIQEEDKEQPDLALIIFVTGYHDTSFYSPRVGYEKPARTFELAFSAHPDKAKTWCFRDEEDEYFAAEAKSKKKAKAS